MMIRGEVRSPAQLGRALTQARLLAGLSQRELASQLGLTQKWLWELEQGKPGLFTDRLFEVLRATGARLSIEIDAPADGDAPTDGDHA